MTDPDIEFSSDPQRLDLDMVTAFLSQSYWAEGRSREKVERCVAHSLCVGAYLAGRQIGFGRIVTDRTVIGYLADVFVLPEWRGRGIGQGLMRHMLEHPDVAGLKLILLRTRDAQEFYRRLGFAELPRIHEMMGLYRQ